MHRIHDLDPDFRLETRQAAAALSPALEGRVAALWDVEKRLRGDRLYNGPIYSLIAIAPDRLTVEKSEYRQVLARRRDPTLAKAGLDPRPLAVTGLLTCRDGVVLGRRAEHVAADAGLWEPAPSGGLDQPDPLAQLMAELGEELGIASDLIKPPRVCGLVEDVESAVFDIVYRIETDLDAAAIKTKQRQAGSDEYAEIAVIGMAELPSFLAAHERALLPALRPMLRRGGLLVA